MKNDNIVLILGFLVAFSLAFVVSDFEISGNKSPETYSDIRKVEACNDDSGSVWRASSDSGPLLVGSNGFIIGFQTDSGSSGGNQTYYFAGEKPEDICSEDFSAPNNLDFNPDKKLYSKYNFEPDREGFKLCRAGLGKIYSSDQIQTDILVFESEVIGLKSSNSSIFFKRPPSNAECLRNRYLNQSEKNSAGAEIENCWGEKCERETIKFQPESCEEWYFFKNREKLSCEWTKDGLDKVSMVTDPANYIKAPIAKTDYRTDILLNNIGPSWDIEFLPDGRALITQQDGRLKLFEEENGARTISQINVLDGEFIGLLGLAVDPNFEENNFIYVHYTYSYAGDQNGTRLDNERLTPTLARVSRFKLVNGSISDEKILMDEIPGHNYHAGGGLDIGPDGKLYVTTGSASSWREPPYEAQNASSRLGKILRLNLNGTVPEDNPFNQSYVYSRGHRNPQGLAWNSENQLYATEHGPWRYDEINRIEPGANYGWGRHKCGKLKEPSVPLIGEQTEPVFCPEDWTMAPSGATFVNDPESPWNGKLFVAGLRSEHLHSFTFNEDGSVKKDSVFYIPKGTEWPDRVRDVEYRNGSLWVLGDFNWLVKLTPRQNTIRKNR